MKVMGIFEVKTRLSEICEQVAETRESIMVTRRGNPLVRIEPIASDLPSVRERRAAYDARYKHQEEPDQVDFEPPPRDDRVSGFQVED